MSFVALLLFPAAMALAASSDLLTMRISNKLVLFLVASFCVLALAINLPLQQFAMHVVCALAVLAVGFTLFALRWIGGGDAKLAAATTLWLGFGLTLPYLVYAGLLGLMLSSVFLAYTGASITRTFFISAASFGALSLYGYTTQRDLSPIGSFLIMGLFGLILAMIVNMFLKSTGLEFAISAIGVLIFAGLTAWDTQKIKEMYSANDDGTVAGRKAVMGALTLYLDFINLFLFLLRFMGDRR